MSPNVDDGASRGETPGSLNVKRQLPPLETWVALAAIVGVFVYLYGFLPYASGYGAYRVTIAHFCERLWQREEWQHCYLIPFAVAAIVYMDRKQLLALPIKTSWIGLAVLVGGFATYWIGYRVDNIYIGYASFQLLVGGLILFLFGWRWMLRLAFPWAFLMFLYPLVFLDNNLAFPLRMVMSEASVTVLNFIGIASTKVGTAIVSAADPALNLREGERFAVDVADPCSGIRSLFALLMVTALYGHFMLRGFWRKWVLFLCAAPLAVLGNLGRILMLTFGTITMGPEKAIGTLEDPTFFHMLAGYLVFAVALGGMVAIGALLNMDFKGVWNAIQRRPDRPSSSGTGKSAMEDAY